MRAGWAGDDVWGLPPLPSQPPDSDDLNGVTGGGSWNGGKVYYWITTPIANKWHDCSGCRDIIGPGDPYYREAIPMHNLVLVFKMCCKCK